MESRILRPKPKLRTAAKYNQHFIPCDPRSVRWKPHISNLLHIRTISILYPYYTSPYFIYSNACYPRSHKEAGDELEQGVLMGCFWRVCDFLRSDIRQVELCKNVIWNRHLLYKSGSISVTISSIGTSAAFWPTLTPVSQGNGPTFMQTVWGKEGSLKTTHHMVFDLCRMFESGNVKLAQHESTWPHLCIAKLKERKTEVLGTHYSFTWPQTFTQLGFAWRSTTGSLAGCLIHCTNCS